MLHNSLTGTLSSSHQPPTHVYKYSPLTQKCQPDRYTIRLLHLLPADDDNAPLRCRLVEKGYNDHWSHQVHPEYHALSYTWGEPIFPEVLDVLSNNVGTLSRSVGVIYITKNLQSALKHLRQKDGPMLLWVDAICINQADVTERNSQVSNMPKIYKKASSTIVWLGDESDHRDARLCMNFFKDLHELAASAGEDRPSASWRNRFEINRLVADFLGENRSKMVYFLERPWFRRRWIVQEVVLAKSVAMHCGAWKIDWDTFHLAMFELFESGQEIFTLDHRTTMRTMTGVRSGSRTITAVRNLGVAVKKQLPLDTLVEFSSFQCIDPRDRLYALYGVIKLWSPRQITMQLSELNNIDYSLPTERVFTNFATELLQIDARDLGPMASKYCLVTHALQLAGAFRHGNGKEDRLSGKIPSWVIDWTATLCFEPLQHSPKAGTAFKAHANNDAVQFIPARDNPSLLVMVGLPFDIVTRTIPLDISPMLLTDTVHKAKASLSKFLSQVAGCVEGDWYGPTAEHLIEALATSLVANWDHTPGNSYFGQDPRFIRDFLEQLRHQQYHLPEMLHKWPAYVELMAITMRGRSLILTAKGYMGIAARDVEAGDIRAAGYTSHCGENGAVVVPDCFDYRDVRYSYDVAMLAQDPSLYNSFRLVSDAYVHGLMKGEALEIMGRDGENLPLKILPIA
ncbi:heterokaryon incompatibility protein-domain-containing protein [Triangularia verruculosa]|uniref:Heterokaryon incompatibility protein-domain-containing protein n=1 Tax=Triangularia verruculosa TaxID=2587418 RepID=A0AAN7AZ81_9PEZI|nr:heterokaryon incompatibility protein-domain-containing protein [Triangularia verruculosa]